MQEVAEEAFRLVFLDAPIITVVVEQVMELLALMEEEQVKVIKE